MQVRVVEDACAFAGSAGGVADGLIGEPCRGPLVVVAVSRIAAVTGPWGVNWAARSRVAVRPGL